MDNYNTVAIESAEQIKQSAKQLPLLEHFRENLEIEMLLFLDRSLKTHTPLHYMMREGYMTAYFWDNFFFNF